MTVQLYDADDLIESVRNYAMCGDTNSTGTRDEDILRYLNEELWLRVFPLLVQIREEFGIYTERVALSSGTFRYRISKRAAYNRLRDVIFLNSSGTRRSLPKIEREHIGRYSATPADEPAGFFLEWDHVVLVPEISTTPAGSLELSYPFRPPQIVASEEVATITAIDTSTGVVTLSAAPAAFAAAIRYDIHGPESGAEIRVYDVLASAYSAVTPSVTFTPADINGSGYGRYVPQVGDYVCLARQCAVPFLPLEMHPLLAQATAVRLLRAVGHLEAADKQDAAVKEAMQAALVMTDDRVDGEPDVVVNQYSFLGGSWPYGTGRANQF